MSARERRRRRGPWRKAQGCKHTTGGEVRMFRSTWRRAGLIAPVVPGSAASIVTKAKAQNVPVVSYDRLIKSADLKYYISFDNARVGTLQATSLDARLKQLGKPTGPIIMVNGDPADNNAHLFKSGATTQFK